jgi:hypothetical protein
MKLGKPLATGFAEETDQETVTAEAMTPESYPDTYEATPEPQPVKAAATAR